MQFLDLQIVIYRRFQTPLQQATFERIVAKGWIARNDTFILLPQFVYLYSIILLSFIKIFHIYVGKFLLLYTIEQILTVSGT